MLHRNMLQRNMLLVVLVTTLLKLMGEVKAQKACAEIEKECTFDSYSPKCKDDRIRFMSRCYKLINEKNKEPECNSRCRDFLLELQGKDNDIMKCDCLNDMGCIVLRKRIVRCINETLKHKTSCFKALEDCKKDEQCYTLYKNRFAECQSMFHGFACGLECVIAQQKLYSNAVGKTLETCECAGGFEEEKFCITTRLHQKQLCKAESTQVTASPVKQTIVVCGPEEQSKNFVVLPSTSSSNSNSKLTSALNISLLQIVFTILYIVH